MVRQAVVRGPGWPCAVCDIVQAGEQLAFAVQHHQAVLVLKIDREALTGPQAEPPNERDQRSVRREHRGAAINETRVFATLTAGGDDLSRQRAFGKAFDGAAIVACHGQERVEAVIGGVLAVHPGATRDAVGILALVALEHLGAAQVVIEDRPKRPFKSQRAAEPAIELTRWDGGQHRGLLCRF